MGANVEQDNDEWLFALDRLVSDGIDEEPNGGASLFFIGDVYAQHMTVWTDELLLYHRGRWFDYSIEVHAPQHPNWAIFLILTDDGLTLLTSNFQQARCATAICSILIGFEPKLLHTMFTSFSESLPTVTKCLRRQRKLPQSSAAFGAPQTGRCQKR